MMASVTSERQLGFVENVILPCDGLTSLWWRLWQADVLGVDGFCGVLEWKRLTGGCTQPVLWCVITCVLAGSLCIASALCMRCACLDCVFSWGVWGTRSGFGRFNRKGLQGITCNPVPTGVHLCLQRVRVGCRAAGTNLSLHQQCMTVSAFSVAACASLQLPSLMFDVTW